MDKTKELCSHFLETANADCLGFALIDFRNKKIDSFEMSQEGLENIYFDYASLTKPLVNSTSALLHKNLSPEMELLLNHRAGFPSWSVLDKRNWKEYLLSLPIKESEVVYSDLSALRFLLEAYSKWGDVEKELKKFWDREIVFWTELSGKETFCQNGYRSGKPIMGQVHDPNAYNLKEFTSHAGLFGTVDGLARTLLKMDSELEMLDFIDKQDFTHRFVWGFDTASQKGSLAGDGHSEKTFGHLGFTGTSFWIDAVKGVGTVLLTNSTKEYWFDKVELNELRRKLGAYIWQNY